MPHRNIRTPDDLDALWKLFSGFKMPFSVDFEQGENRSAQQNRLQHLWAKEAATQRQDRSAEDQRAEWKLVHGVPILRAENTQFRAAYDGAIRGLPYEAKIACMKEPLDFPVTRQMNVKQMVAYLDAIERECAETGVVLTQPDPDLAAYHERNRQRRAA